GAWVSLQRRCICGRGGKRCTKPPTRKIGVWAPGDSAVADLKIGNYTKQMQRTDLKVGHYKKRWRSIATSAVSSTLGAASAPDAGDERPALRAGAVLDAVVEHIVPGTPDEQLAATRTVGVRGVAEDVSLIDVVQPDLERDFARAVQGFGRGGRFVLQLEIRVKRGEMQRYVGAKVFQNPFGEAPGFGGIVV